MMQAAFIRIADIHAWTLADGFQTFEFVDLRGVVFLVFGDCGGSIGW
jgi:hypothetical protein